MSLYNMVSK